MSDQRPVDYAALLKRSLLAIDQLEAKVAAAERARSEPIAIVGIGCRFPGGANTPEAFWRLLHDGVDAVTEVPKERWDIDQYFDADPDAAGKTYARWGAFLRDVDQFDPAFFGISPREAVSMDPQQRLLLEMTWEALEHAGIAPSSLSGSQTAVYVGMATHDYAGELAEAAVSRFGDAYTASGTAHSVAAGRISYVLGLHGPNVAMDTACSSSLVALHWAMQSLRLGEADVALAGGINLTLTPNGSVLLSRARMMSTTGRCRSFDASADGYVRGEGGAMLALKRLSDARRDGDRILALLRGSAINQDGRSSGLTAPNGRAQEAVMRAALANARLRPAEIDYVEAHGTGTPLGDPIEVGALNQVFGGRPSGHALQVGSVKTNIGHLEAAAGVAGVLKVVLALQHRCIPPNLHFDQPNPMIPWDKYAITVPVRPTEWVQRDGAPMRAGVNSFGFSGTNAHVVLEEAPPDTRQGADGGPGLLLLSAQTPAALMGLAERYADALEGPSGPSWPDVIATAALGRSHLDQRLALVAGDAAGAAAQLRAFAAGDAPTVASAHVVGGAIPEVVFMFTGQGAQYPGMARRLSETEPVFRQALEECDRILRPILPRPLLEVIFSTDEAAAALLGDTAFTQPALFAVEYALAQLWRSWGVEPAVVLGHSVGEYVAACVAGVFTLEDGLKLIAERGRLMGSLPRDGAMAAVFAGEDRVRGLLGGEAQSVAIATINGPQNTVVSGRREAVDMVLQRAIAQGLEAQVLKVSHAFHSPLMEPILDQFEAAATEVRFTPPAIGLVSNLSGRLAGPEVCTPGYWRRHIRDAVRFGESIAAMHADGHRVFLEVGPTTTLIGMAQQVSPEAGARWIPSLRKGRDDTSSMLEALGQLYVAGVAIDWARVLGPGSTTRRATLPTYPYQRARYWHSLERGGGGAGLHPLRTPHPILTGRLDSALPIYQGEIALASHPWLADHRMFDLVLFPAAGFLDLAQAAAADAFDGAALEIRDLVIGEGLQLMPGNDMLLQVSLTPASDDSFDVRVFSRPGGDLGAAWRLHASMLASRRAAVPSHRDLGALRSTLTQVVDVQACHERLMAQGAHYGRAFKAIRSVTCAGNAALGEVQLEEGIALGGMQLHPALLDACFQVVGTVMPGDEICVPLGLVSYRVHRAGISGAWCHVTTTQADTEGKVFRADLVLMDEAGVVLAELQGLELRRVQRAALQRALSGAALQDWAWDVEWRAVPLAAAAGAREPGRWIVFSDASGIGDAVGQELAAGGDGVVRVRPGASWQQHGDTWEVSPGDPAQYRRLLAEAGARDARPLKGILFLWPLDEAGGADRGIDALLTVQQHLLTAGLHLAQALGDASTRLWVVTRGTQAVAGALPDLAQAPFWGLAGVIAVEMPGLACTRIDLAPVPEEGEARNLVDGVLHPDEELRVAWRAGARLVARLVAASIQGQHTGKLVHTQHPAIVVRPDASYLITGGLGGLGLASARGLVDAGARHLVLMGRRAPSPAAEREVEALRAAGATIVVEQGDVADAAVLAAALARIEQPLRGVLHAAGSVDDAMLPELTPARFEGVMAPKVRGTWNLHTLTAAAPLDFFVMFSSGAALLGSPGQANYAAANTFMDALAHQRRARGLPATSINWGTWSDVGMAAVLDQRYQRRWASMGLGMIAPDDGIRMLQAILASNRSAQVAALPLVISKLPASAGSFFADLLACRRTTPAASDGPAATPGGDLLALLAAAPEGERPTMLSGFLSEQVVKVLALPPGQVDRHRSLMELGMDSLMAMELRNRLQSALKVRVAVADLLRGPSIETLGAELLASLRTGEEQGSAPATTFEEGSL